MRFYTTPKGEVEWPYWLVNPRTEKRLLNSGFEHAIADSGVMIFVHEDITEYPQGFLREWKYKAKLLTDIYGEDRISCVIPDYPDDYNPGQFGDNVEKTISNIEDFISVDGPKWVVSLQSRYLDKFSFLKAVQEVKDLLGHYPNLAIGTVCKCNRIEFIKYCCDVARQHFPKSWLHAFGLTLRALPHVNETLDSWDSMAWTFPRKPGGRSHRGGEEVEYFDAYVNRIAEIMTKEDS